MSSYQELNRVRLIEMVSSARKALPEPGTVTPEDVVGNVLETARWSELGPASRSSALVAVLESITPDYRLSRREEIRLYLSVYQRTTGLAEEQSERADEPAPEPQEFIDAYDEFEFLELRARRLLLEELEHRSS